MSDNKSLFISNLRSNGYSVTTTRLSVFNVLEHSEPISIKELIKCCESIDRASVYRTVDLFEKLGILQRIQLGWKYKIELTDRFHDHHHHITCTKCGHVEPLHEDKKLEKILDKLASSHGYVATMHQLEMQGTCVKCHKS